MSQNGVSKSVYFAQTRDIKEGNSIPKLQSSSEFLSLGPDTSEIISVSAVCMIITRVILKLQFAFELSSVSLVSTHFGFHSNFALNRPFWLKV